MIVLRSLLVLAILAAGPVLAGDGAHGQLLYAQRCSACHSLDANRVGPMHRGVFGRRAGSVSGYAYSPALQYATIVWNEKTWILGWTTRNSCCLDSAWAIACRMRPTGLT